MNKVFIDSNVWLYAFIKSDIKTETAKKIIKGGNEISISP